MKKYLIVLLLFGVALISCDKDIEGFDNSVNYIYFDIPYKLNMYDQPLADDVREDSITYSFALDKLGVTSAVIDVIVNVVGEPSNTDRPYSVLILEDYTDLNDDGWNPSILKDRKIAAGKLSDTIKIDLKRTEALRDQWKHLCLKIEANDFFELGDVRLQEVLLSFSDILNEPKWWKTWQTAFGPFCREKYLKWIELYFEGADQTRDNNGNLFYWDNMPTIPVPSWYPSTFKYLGVLKQFFIDNEIYPDGDTSKPRVSIP